MNKPVAGSTRRKGSTSTKARAVDHPDPRRRAFRILAHVADSRRCVYRWLALGFYPPDVDLITALATGQMVAEIEASTAWLGQDRDQLAESVRALRGCAGLSLADLDEEYSRLFGKSIERVAPRETAYRWRDVHDLSTVSPASNSIVRTLQQEYQQFNVAPIPGQEDHVAVELEFLSYLCEREAANWASSAGEAARLLRRQQRSFLDDHLGRWLSEFCQRVLERSTPQALFYGPLAAFTDSWLSLEHGPGYLKAVRA